MLEEQLERRPVMSMSKTPGLTSNEQLVDSTANEIFSFQETTSETEEILVVVPPSYETEEVESED